MTHRLAIWIPPLLARFPLNVHQILHLYTDLQDQDPKDLILCTQSTFMQNILVLPNNFAGHLILKQVFPRSEHAHWMVSLVCHEFVSTKWAYLTSFWGVKFDSHKWFRSAPFHVALNLVSHSDLASDSAENPADPTRIKCWTCSGCWKIQRYARWKVRNQKS